MSPQRSAILPRSEVGIEGCESASLNGLGNPVSYKLLPAGSPSLLASETSAVVSRGGAFVKRHIWATPYAEGEFSAAGTTP